jgi:hypothetical protein
MNKVSKKNTWFELRAWVNSLIVNIWGESSPLCRHVGQGSFMTALTYIIRPIYNKTDIIRNILNRTANLH